MIKKNFGVDFGGGTFPEKTSWELKAAQLGAGGSGQKDVKEKIRKKKTKKEKGGFKT